MKILSLIPVSAMRFFNPATKLASSTASNPVITAVHSGYFGSSSSIASTNKSVPFCERTLPNTPMPYLPGKPDSFQAAALFADG